MFPLTGYLPNPRPNPSDPVPTASVCTGLRPRLLPVLLIVLLPVLLLAAASLSAQTPADRVIDIPSAPEPQVPSTKPDAQLAAIPPAQFLAQLAAPQPPAPTPAIDSTSEQTAPVFSMAPHTSNRYWISGQANVILQGDLPFHSPYEGAHSFISQAEAKASYVATLYTALRPTRSIRYSTDFVLDIESTGGRGLSDAYGLAGFTNLDVVRNPTLSSVPYLARYQVHQVIGLTRQTTPQDPSFYALAPSVPVRRIDLRIGKLTLPDFFDVNDIGTDSHLQFLNWTVDNNGAWDYAADTRGYSVGGIAEYDDRVWSFRYGIFAMPTVANGISLDWAFSRAHGQNGEFELRRGFLPKHQGTQRLLFYANRAHMGDYRLAVQAWLAGTDKAPDITLHESFGALKYGFGYNTQQQVTANLRLFGRFGWNEGQHESFAYTEVDQTAEAGGDYTLARWHRPVDKIGVVVVSNAIKKDHQIYLKDGGLGFLLGDGNLNYAREDIQEGYYNLHAWRGLFYALDVQHISHPGYNRDRGPVWVGSLRMHVDF